MPIINAANRIEERKMRKEEGVRTDYARLEIDLGNASFVGTDIEIAVSGSYLAKIKYEGDNTTYFRLDKRHAGKIYADEFKAVRREYDRLWFTNPVAQSGRKLVLQVGQIDYAEIVPEVKSENVPPLMLTDKIEVILDAAIDSIAAPGVGKALEVFGFQIKNREDSTAVFGDPAFLYFLTSGVYLWIGNHVAPAADRETFHSLSGIRVRGAENEALTLLNTDVTAGTPNQISAIVFYRVVRV